MENAVAISLRPMPFSVKNRTRSNKGLSLITSEMRNCSASFTTSSRRGKGKGLECNAHACRASRVATTFSLFESGYCCCCDKDVAAADDADAAAEDDDEGNEEEDEDEEEDGRTRKEQRRAISGVDGGDTTCTGEEEEEEVDLSHAWPKPDETT